MNAFSVVHELEPRFRDTDAMGHINNAVYVTYLEVARQEYWRRLKRTRDYRSVPFILAHVTIDFRAEALMDEVLLLGPVERCRERLAAFREAGIEYPLLAPQPVDDGAEAAGMRLMAAFAR